MTVREVLGHRWTAYVERLYRKVIHFILSMLIVGFNQTTKTERNNASNSFVSTSSRSALLVPGRKADTRQLANTTNNNKTANRRSPDGSNKNCWSDVNCGPTTAANDTAVTSNKKADNCVSASVFVGNKQPLPGQISHQ